ncbi:inactive hydroxysteroid dehydrogenase-like protein 1 [Aplysia californica]|uniref:Inactive hydroxysteroid dehydrogenase-like protein 1 n=1 Tax=Aplysia californica TaxID=6500 RepID=A0ABM0JKR8_APLCA|nr:inactive hydroxysteroid dehydrogenase-like protein 1 [Aplysia californica]
MRHESIDSFIHLWRQLENEARELFSDVRDVFALIGAYYVARKSIAIASYAFEAINLHLVCQLSSVDNEYWVKRYGPWAVVTGSSEGIGQAYATELAKRGLNVVLISRNERKLMKAKAEIEGKSGVKVEYIVADFAAQDQAQVYGHIKDKLADKEIGLLVNNVGVMYDYPDVLLNISSQKLWQLIYVNIGAATMMSHMLLPQMVNRGRGGLVIVSSGSSTQITPQMTVYSATKRYLDYFIQGMAYEYRNSGVTFQCLVPFYVLTRMTGYSDQLSKNSWFIPDARNFAKSAVRTLGHSTLTTGYFCHTLQLWIAYLLPLRLWMWASEKLNNSLRKEALNRHSRRPLASVSSDTSPGSPQV